MRMKRREGEKHEWIPVFAHPGVSVFRGGHFAGVWIFGAAAAEGSREIHSVVVLPFSRGGNRNWLADVPFFSLTEIAPLRFVDSDFPRMLS